MKFTGVAVRGERGGKRGMPGNVAETGSWSGQNGAAGQGIAVLAIEIICFDGIFNCIFQYFKLKLPI